MNTEQEKKHPVLTAERWFILVLLAITAVLMLRFKGNSLQRSGEIRALTEGWYYIHDGIKTEVTLPAVIPADEEESLVLFLDNAGESLAGKTVTTRGAQYDLKIQMNQDVLYEYRENEEFPRNAQMKSKLDCDAEIPADSAGGTLSLVYQTPQNGKYEISEVYAGSGATITELHFRDSVPMLLIVIVLLVLGVIAAGISIYLYYRKMPDRRFRDVAQFFILCGLWSLTDSSLMQNNFAYPTLLCIFSFYMFMLLAVPMLHFLKNIGNMARYKILDWGLLAFYVNAAAQGLLNALGIFEFTEMLFVTHILLAAGVAVCECLLILEYRNCPDRETRMLLWAFGILGTGGVLALLLYWLWKIPYYGAIFEGGVIAFMILILADTIITVTENVRYRTEMKIYEQMQKEDRMTGLENRRPFDDRLTEIQDTLEYQKNILLIFFDIRHLRRTNEEYGRNVGDSLIIAASRCIHTVFGEIGSCYRIGGDEFSVLVFDPPKEPQEYFDALEEEISIFNRGSRYRLSMSWGKADLRDKNGRVKNISDWKHEADTALYLAKEKEA